MRILQNENGLTLVEVLAVLVISSIVSILVINIMVTGLNMQKKITIDAQLREEADNYMLSLTNMFYTLKESTVCDGDLKTSSDPNNVFSYIETSTNCSNPSIPKVKTGFIQEANGNLALYIEDKKISGANDDIVIDPSSQIKKYKNIYNVTLTLDYNGKAKTFQNEIHSVLNY